VIHIQNRDDLVDLVAKCPRKTIQRLVDLDRVVCLGLFLPGVAPGDERIAWLFNVVGFGGRHYIIAMLLKGHSVKYRLLKGVPWHLWDGDNGLKGGDHPGRYALKRADAIREINRAKTNAKHEKSTK